MIRELFVDRRAERNIDRKKSPEKLQLIMYIYIQNLKNNLEYKNQPNRFQKKLSLHNYLSYESNRIELIVIVEYKSLPLQTFPPNKIER